MAEIGSLPTGGLKDPTPDWCLQREALLGPYSLDNSLRPVPLFDDALRTALQGTGASVDVQQGCHIDIYKGLGLNLIPAAVNAALHAESVVLVVGDTLQTCDENQDVITLDLPGGQQALLDAVAGNLTQQAVARAASVHGISLSQAESSLTADEISAFATPVVMVLVHGRPLTFAAESQNNTLLWDGDASPIGAVLDLWRPGERGAVAAVDAILGRFSPSGREPAAWPSSVGAIKSGAAPFLSRIVGDFVSNGHRSKALNPPGGRSYVDYVTSAGSGTPLVSFGHGLGYADITYESIRLQPNASTLAHAASWITPEDWEVHHGDTVATATVRVTRGSDGASAPQGETVQVFLNDPAGVTLTARFWMRLAGFAKVQLASG